MRLTTDEHPMMLAEPSQNEKAVREKMVEIMFEKYNVPGEFVGTTTDVYIPRMSNVDYNMLLCSRLCCKKCRAKLICHWKANLSGH